MLGKDIFDSDLPNDEIDIYANPDVNIKKIEPETEDEFRIELSGTSIDDSVVNALRRTILLHIPIYGFHRSNIFIEVDKSRNMYNNDMLYNQIEMLVIFDIPNYYDLEDPETFLSTKIMKTLFGKFIQERHEDEDDENDENQIHEEETKNDEEETKNDEEKKRLFKIELSINVKNKTINDIAVSTHDAVLKINGKIVDSYRKRSPMDIIFLKPTEEISLRAEANLGIAKIHASYEATTNAILNEISPTKYILYYQTLGQLDNDMIFSKACTILIKKFEYLQRYISKKYKKEHEITETIEIPILGEEHTLGNLLSTVLQKCKFVEKAAYVMQHPFIDEMTIVYKLTSKSKIGPIQVLVDSIGYLIKLFKSIRQLRQ